ncbi:Mitochondrial 2-oxoadipate and 2-oxoglutarate transporter [Datura stramonium]|uniref:Mitochondrial 2-oxoadipate and 2-oxoglutarate transporter n=1 Tax=Datura stramonium TaxID=4076 RepID=A0ABS8SSS7_DATST|nr:Mitochondrial 2-oxoadipate and 2-oxoglutarate transporter [Datura stramonium]
MFGSEYVLSLGISPDRIIFANPCKPESDIIFGVKVGVNLTTFDSEEEVYKICKHHRKCDLLLRIKPMDDSNARCPMRPKYGALPEEVEPLLKTAQAARLTVSGVSFHTGSGDADSKDYLRVIAAARGVFATAARFGMFKMTVLDIGGGFTSDHQFTTASAAVISRKATLP